MPASGQYGFSPNVAEHLDEAFENCGIDPAALVARHVRAARRSINLLCVEWSNDGAREWTSSEQPHTVTTGETNFTVNAGCVMVKDVTCSRDGKETPMLSMSREEYRMIYDKTVKGRPASYFFDKQTPLAKLYYWFAAENSTDLIKYTQVLRIQDVLTSQETVDVPYQWQDALSKGLSARLAKKFRPDLYVAYLTEAMAAFKLAKRGDRDGSDLRIRRSSGR